MRIRSQLTVPKVAIDRNVDNTTIDKIDAVYSNITAIEQLGKEDVITDMSVLADVDFTAISDKITTLNDLTASVTMLDYGSTASAELSGNTIQLEIPNGKDGKDGKDGINGKDGKDGYTPVKGIDYTDGVDGYTPVKGKDYFDGENGKDGNDGSSPVMQFTYNKKTGDIDYSVAYWSSTLGKIWPSTIEWGNTIIFTEGNNKEW